MVPWITCRVASLLTVLAAPLSIPAGRAEAALLTKAQAVKAFAPVVRLHPSEKFQPMNPGEFLANSSLNYARAMRPDAKDLVPKGAIDAGRLGRGEYTYQGSRTNENNRPRDGAGDGFFLNLDNGRRAGAAGGPVAAFYDFVPGRWLTYWFFYGYSESERPSPTKVTGSGSESNSALTTGRRASPSSSTAEPVRCPGRRSRS